MTDPVPDRAAAEAAAAAERLMAQARLQQAIETRHAASDRTATTWIIVGATTLFGAVMGALAGARHGHSLVLSLLFAVVGGMLAVVRQRAL
ncbi:hypothetical protein [Lysobacter xanthus]